MRDERHRNITSPGSTAQFGGSFGLAALALAVQTDPAIAAGQKPSDDELATALHCFRWHVALESLRRQGLMTVDAISGAIFDPAFRVRVRLQDRATGRWQVGELSTGESVFGTALRVAALGLEGHAAEAHRPLRPPMQQLHRGVRGADIFRGEFPLSDQRLFGSPQGPGAGHRRRWRCRSASFLQLGPFRSSWTMRLDVRRVRPPEKDHEVAIEQVRGIVAGQPPGV